MGLLDILKSAVTRTPVALDHLDRSVVLQESCVQTKPTLSQAYFLHSFFRQPAPNLALSSWTEDSWNTALQETWQAVFQRFLKSKHLIPAQLRVEDALYQIQSVWGVAELKVMCREQGLRLSGRKEQLASSLLEHDYENVKAAYETLSLLELSSKGVDFANLYSLRVNSLRAELLSLLREALYQQAVDSAAKFDKELGFSKSPLQINADAEDMKRIMTAQPSILEGCSRGVLNTLREHVALCQLGVGSSRKKEDLRENIPETRFDFEVAARMLTFNAAHYRRLDGTVSAGLEEVEVMAVCDAQICAYCRSINGKRYHVRSVPDLPHRKCSSVQGCRCMASSVIPESWHQ